MQSHLMAAVEEFINSGAEPAERMIHDTVECELAYINTDHPMFLGGSRAISIVMERRSRLPDDSSEDEHRAAFSMAGDLAIARHSKSPGTLAQCVDALQIYQCQGLYLHSGPLAHAMGVSGIEQSC